MMHFRGKNELRAVVLQKEGAKANLVLGEHDPAGALVPGDQRKTTPQLVEHSLSPALVRPRQQGLGVSSRILSELLRELSLVVDGALKGASRRSLSADGVGPVGDHGERTDVTSASLGLRAERMSDSPGHIRPSSAPARIVDSSEHRDPMLSGPAGALPGAGLWSAVHAVDWKSLGPPLVAQP